MIQVSSATAVRQVAALARLARWMAEVDQKRSALPARELLHQQTNNFAHLNRPHV